PQIPMVRVVVSQLPDGLVVTPRMKQNEAIGDRNASNRSNPSASERIKFAGTLDPLQGFVRPPLAQQPLSVPDVSTSIVRVQLQSPLEFRFGVAPLPLFLIYPCKQDVWFRKVRIQFNCFSSCTHHFGVRFHRGVTAKNRSELLVCVREADVSRCKINVLADRFLKVGNTLFKLGLAAALAEFIFGFKIALVNFRRDMMRRDQPGTLLSGDLDLDSARDGLRHLALKSKYIPQLAVVLIRPKVLVG